MKRTNTPNNNITPLPWGDIKRQAREQSPLSTLPWRIAKHIPEKIGRDKQTAIATAITAIINAESKRIGAWEMKAKIISNIIGTEDFPDKLKVLKVVAEI